MSRKHCLQLNAVKCIIFGGKRDREKFLQNFGHDIVLCGEIIYFQDSVRNLGLIMDHNLRFAGHVSRCLSRAYLNLRMIYQCRAYLNKYNRQLLCESLVLSHMNFCDVVYGPCLTVFDVNRVQKLQNCCLRYIHGIRKYEPITHTLKLTGWLSMKHRRQLHSSILYFNVIKNATPLDLYSRIKLRSSVHCVNVRSREDISIPMHRTSLFERAFSYQVPKIMNELKFDYRNITLDKFMLHIRNNFRNDPLYNGS